jgi:hypothetical protein
MIPGLRRLIAQDTNIVILETMSLASFSGPQRTWVVKASDISRAHLF